VRRGYGCESERACSGVEDGAESGKKWNNLRKKLTCGSVWVNPLHYGVFHFSCFLLNKTFKFKIKKGERVSIKLRKPKLSQNRKWKAENRKKGNW